MYDIDEQQIRSCMKEEIWKDAVGWEGIYQVSNFGRVRSLDRVVYGKYSRHCKGQLLVLRYDKDGYLTAHCRNITEGKNMLVKVHRMVAEAFIPKKDLFRTEVDHINGMRDDNRAENLRWCTTKENLNYPIAKENRSISIKESYNKYPELRAKRAEVFRLARAANCKKIKS